MDLKAIQPRIDAFERLLALDKKCEQIAKFGRPAGTSNQRLAGRVEKQAAQIITRLGYPVRFTPNNAPWDLWAGGAKIEVKASRWSNLAGRYQAQVRNHMADLLIFDAINGADHFFIIPGRSISGKTIEIPRYDVRLYAGRWAEFLEAWEHLHRVIEAAPRLPIQLELGLCPDMTT